MTKKLISLLLAVVLVLGSGWPAAFALKEKSRLVRVAYPIQPGLTTVDENGNYSGFSYEYLEEVAQYTGWDYEFVQVPGDDLNDSLTTLMEMVKNGEVDLMSGMLYSESTAEDYDFASHSYGASETVFQVPYDSPQDVVINSQIYQTLRIATIARSGSRIIKESDDYCKMNLVEPEYIYVDSTEEQQEAVRDGRADVLLNTSVNYIGGVRTVARFAQKPFYFVTAKDSNIEMMEELNSAILSIDQTDPYFSSTLYEKYFSPPNDVLLLSDAEKKYIEEAGVIRVGVLTGKPPYQYVGDDGSLQGIAVDLLDYISKETGLKFKLVRQDSPEQLYAAGQAGEIDMVAGMTYDYTLAREQNLSLSRPYLSSQYLIMMNESTNEDSIQGKRLALVSTTAYHGETLGVVSKYDTVSACIDAVKRGDADYTYVDSYTAQYYINLPEYKNMRLAPQTHDAQRVCFGVVKPGRLELLSTLNKAVVTLPEEDIQAIINRNTIKTQPFSLSYLIRENPLDAILALGVIFLFVIAILLMVLRQRSRANKQISLELKKHFRIYALVNEYFFEYNYRKKNLLVTIPQENGSGRTELIQYDYSKPTKDPLMEPWRQAFLDTIQSQNQSDRVCEVELLCTDGQYHWLRIALETIYDEETPVYAVGKINIIDEEKREKDTLLRKAQLDSLTHLYNAEACRENVIAGLSRLGPGEHGALMLVDIDHFKSINDTYGHLRGDQVLARLAKLLRECFPLDNVVGRPGGDEFLVYIGAGMDAEALEQKCRNLCGRAHEIPLESNDVLTISAGAALSACGDDYPSLYELADQALYLAKERGRDQYHISARPGPGMESGQPSESGQQV